jgi:ubiquinone/menaquinone biosynthesis C-methylase UbiE
MKLLTEADLLELESQLSCPKGEVGVAVGDKMNNSNFGMTRKSIQCLDLDKDHSVLELGHGNCGHLKLITDYAEGINYHGLEVSETMWKEAQKISGNSSSEFKLYDGHCIPYPDDSFNRIFTVNTIYFWSDPEALIKEIERTLLSQGLFVLTFADKSFMKQLPFVREKFRLYDEDDVYELIKSTSLSIIDVKYEKDEVISKSGDQVSRKYLLVKMIKN